jgi:DNA-binding NarL/FixJ family response regulator
MIYLCRREKESSNLMYNILIVDDDEKHVFSAMLYLNAKGFKTFETRSGKEAFKLLEIIQPDLIILEILMPDMDGYKFITILKMNPKFKKIPFIFLSAKGMTQDRIEGYRVGCSNYIPKPFDPEELVAIINSILFRKREQVLELRTLLKNVRNIRTRLENQYNLPYQLQKHLNLTPRECSVLKYTLEGLRNREIALILNTSLRNVENYVTKLLNKTNTRNRVGLVNYCYENGTILRANDGIRTRE